MLLTALATFSFVAGTAWITWQVLEKSRDTLTSTEFEVWLGTVAIASGAVLAGMAVFGRNRPVLFGLILGLVLAAVAIIVGLGVDVFSSAS